MLMTNRQSDVTHCHRLNLFPLGGSWLNNLSTNCVCFCAFQLETLAVADLDVDRARHIPLWIIILSILIGLILLIVIVVLLWKVRRLVDVCRHFPVLIVAVNDCNSHS